MSLFTDRSFRRPTGTAIAILALACSLARLLPSAAAQPIPSRMEEVGRENLPAQKLGVDDLIAVSVYDAPELTRTLRVEADGAIHLPLLKRGVMAKGLLPYEVESRISDALKEEQILVDPIVKVTAVEYHSRPISVMGAVHKPVVFQSVGLVTLLDALAKAEGLADDAGLEVVVTRDGENTRIPLKRLLKDADPTANLILHGGEEIRIPEAGKIYVVGNIKKPGAFPVRDSSDRSVMRMVALSEGLLPFASKIAYIYRVEDGEKKEIPVELDKIMLRKTSDVILQVDDVFYVPDNRTRRNVVTALDRITSFGANTASGVLIWRK
jgi:polysaccharide export outer membrane protein